MLNARDSRSAALPTQAELDEFRTNLRRFIEREIVPFERAVMSEADRQRIQNKAKAAGFWLLDVPEELGGQGLGFLGMAVFWHEVSRTIAIPARDHTLFGPVVGPILMSLAGRAAKALSGAGARGRKDRLLRPDRARCRLRPGLDAHARRAPGRPLYPQRYQALHHPCGKGRFRAGDCLYRSRQGRARRNFLLSGRHEHARRDDCGEASDHDGRRALRDRVRQCRGAAGQSRRSGRRRLCRRPGLAERRPDPAWCPCLRRRRALPRIDHGLCQAAPHLRRSARRPPGRAMDSSPIARPSFTPRN